jgi:phospholipase/lecithinase/hemolysin
MTSVTTRAVAFAKLWLLSFVVGIALLAPGRATADGRPFDRIVVFGDSLSDSGNLFALTGNPGGPDNNWGMDTPAELASLIPSQAYISQRLSNGLTWVELLGTALGRARDVRPAYGSRDIHALNFAVAGATAGNHELLPDESPLHVFHLSGQVGDFLKRAKKIRTTSDTLYVIAIGGNDIRAALGAELVGQDPEAVMRAALDSVFFNVDALHGVGAKKFLIWNAPDLARTPAIQRLDAPVCASVGKDSGCLISGAEDATLKYNTALNDVLTGLRALHPDIEVILFDTAGNLGDIQANPGRYGLTNVVDPCIEVVPFFTIAGTCEQPDRHLFWDGIHPTRAAHAIIAFLVGKALVTHALQDD